MASKDLVNKDPAAVEDAWPLFWVVAPDGGTVGTISPVGLGLGSCLASCWSRPATAELANVKTRNNRICGSRMFPRVLVELLLIGVSKTEYATDCVQDSVMSSGRVKCFGSVDRSVVRLCPAV